MWVRAFFRWQQAGHHALDVFRRGYDGGEAYALERYDSRRQRAMPPAAPFDDEVLKPLA
jgi:hypothetical protein